MLYSMKTVRLNTKELVCLRSNRKKKLSKKNKKKCTLDLLCCFMLPMAKLLECYLFSSIIDTKPTQNIEIIFQDIKREKKTLLFIRWFCVRVYVWVSVELENFAFFFFFFTLQRTLNQFQLKCEYILLKVVLL